MGVGSVEPADVHAYRIAAGKVAAGVAPYVSADGNRTLQYLYSPTFVLCFSPLLRMEGSRGLAWWSACEMTFLSALATCVVLAADISKLGRIAGGFEPEIPWEQGLRKLMKACLGGPTCVIP